MHQLFTCLLLISIGYICPSLSISKYVGDLLPRNRWLCRVRFVLLLVARCCCLCSPRRRPFGWAGGEGFAPLGNPIVHVHLCIGGGRGQCLPPCHCAWAVAAGAPLRMHSSSIHMRLYMWSWLYRWLLPLPPWLLLLPLTPWKRLRLLLLLLQLLLLLLLLFLPLAIRGYRPTRRTYTDTATSAANNAILGCSLALSSGQTRTFGGFDQLLKCMNQNVVSTLRRGSTLWKLLGSGCCCSCCSLVLGHFLHFLPNLFIASPQRLQLQWWGTALLGRRAELRNIWMNSCYLCQSFSAPYQICNTEPHAVHGRERRLAT
mmetsp:Transcript_74252/g.135919  ORF Transcript_74252/g.135919 Transcript_74252/m.135919 type:complete len:316 (-) Transcript_74252:799-1746(-)